MRIALDAMGGDDAPEQIVAGALEAIEHLSSDDELILVGSEETVEAHLPPAGSREGKISVFHAPDVISMDATPIESLRKKPKSSIAVLAKLPREARSMRSSRRAIRALVWLLSRCV